MRRSRTSEYIEGPLPEPRLGAPLTTFVLSWIASFLAVVLLWRVMTPLGGAPPLDLPEDDVLAMLVADAASVLAIWHFTRAFDDVGLRGWADRVQWKPRFPPLPLIITVVGTIAVGWSAISLYETLFLPDPKARSRTSPSSAPRAGRSPSSSSSSSPAWGPRFTKRCSSAG